MGLDMYLNIRRCWEIGHSTGMADALAGAAGTTVDQLVKMSQLDPMMEETSLYLSRWQHSDPAERAMAEEVVDLAGLSDATTDECGSSFIGVDNGRLYVSVNCIYWRKANAIHSWFVKHCQDGIDECQESPVHVEQLAHLRSECIAVVGDPDLADTRLPPQSGFFFGSTDIDEWYIRDLTETADEIKRVLIVATSVTQPGVEFTYRSSW